MDLKILETGNGGDLSKKSKDVSVILGLQNMPYLAMFGGNVKESTPKKRFSNEQAFDYWANNLLFPNDDSLQFNSLTERILNETALTSSGRITIENAVKKDLEFMNPFAKVTASVSIIGLDKIQIYILIQQPNNLQKKEFVYIWDATKSELVDETESSNESESWTADSTLLTADMTTITADQG